jgi:hypothetical protein
MPRTKKAAGQAVDPRNGRRVELEVARRSSEPDPPAELCEEARAQWSAYWADPASMVQAPADRGVALRWISAVDRYWRLIGEADEQPRVRGSTGQLVPNPLYRIAEMALGTIERAEKQLGIGALNRSALGMAVIAERRSLADMNAKYQPEGATGDDDRASSEGEETETFTDPRLSVIPGELA